MGGYLRRGFRFSQSCTVRISSGSAKTQTVQSVRCCLLRFMDRGGVLPLACVFTISYIIPQKFSSCKILCTGLCEITPKINFLFHPMIFSIHFLHAERHKKGQPGKNRTEFSQPPVTRLARQQLCPPRHQQPPNTRSALRFPEHEPSKSRRKRRPLQKLRRLLQGSKRTFPFIFQRTEIRHAVECDVVVVMIAFCAVPCSAGEEQQIIAVKQERDILEADRLGVLASVIQ